ncbi:unnamed protein product [Phytophthora fragariaefolia]|uniref:Unnamed protein product n=1 Tax=Phytophthora fragariaefolia TaxID=1490495 RepID=A0A9W6TWL6_9STRA|nr:unnamed protein product [Phytophthora fragariaefolia]
MVRTKKTNAILRALNLKDDDSSESGDSISSELEKLYDEEVISSEAESDDGVPNAQDTVNIDGSADDEDKSESQKYAESNVESGSDEDHSSQAEGSDHATSERMSTVSDTSSKSRKRALAEVDDEVRLYYVEPLKRYRKNWEKFERYLKKYQRRTLTVLAISETMNVKLRNRHIKKMKMHAGKKPSDLPLIPEDSDPYQRVYICTHGWKEHLQSNGYRPRHRIKCTGCEMRFRAQVVQRSNGEWHVEVKNAYYGHNQEVSPAVYRGYPIVRKIPEEAPIMRDVELMVASGSKPSRVYDYIRTHTPHEVQMQDVYNMFAKLKRSGKLGSSRSGAT